MGNVCLWPPYGIRQTIIFCPVVSSSIYLLLPFSSPNLSRRRLDVYHTSTHCVVLVRISDAGLKRAARGSLKTQDAKSRQKIAIWAPSYNFVGLYLLFRLWWFRWIRWNVNHVILSPHALSLQSCAHNYSVCESHKKDFFRINNGIQLCDPLGRFQPTSAGWHIYL